MIYFTAHTFKCVCHCRRAMFKVLGMYNFGPNTHQGRRQGEGARGASAPPVLDRSVNPTSTRGADYAHHSTTSPPPGFSDRSAGPTVSPRYSQNCVLKRKQKSIHVI